MEKSFLKISITFYTCILILGAFIACTSDANVDGSCGISTSANGAIITNLTARASGPGTSFDGTVNSLAELNTLVETAWGDGGLDLHRGHAPIEAVLESYLGISHADMHVMMENCDMNLAAVCTSFGFEPENLVETLTASFVPHIQKAVSNGVINNAEVTVWTEKVRVQFRNRVNWAG